MRLDQAEARKLHEQGLNGAEIAKRLGVWRQTVTHYFRSIGIRGHQYGFVKTLTDRQRAMLYGTVLGDGHLSRRQESYLAMKHGWVQRAYLTWKVEELAPLFKTTKLHEGTTTIRHKTYRFAQIHSRVHPLLGDARRLFYTDGGKKTVTHDVLDALDKLGPLLSLALAVWYMDDGSLYDDGRYAQITLGGMSQPAYRRTAEWFCQRGFAGAIGKHTTKNSVVFRMHAQGSRRFAKTIIPHIYPSMRYKIPSSLEDPPIRSVSTTCSACGSLITRPKSHARSYSLFCSRECYHEARRARLKSLAREHG